MIRIENLVMVMEDPKPGDERPMLAFETITMAPIDRHAAANAAPAHHDTQWQNAP